MLTLRLLLFIPHCAEVPFKSKVCCVIGFLNELSLYFTDRAKGAGGHNMRDRSTIQRLNMYRQKQRRYFIVEIFFFYYSCGLFIF